MLPLQSGSRFLHVRCRTSGLTPKTTVGTAFCGKSHIAQGRYENYRSWLYRAFAVTARVRYDNYRARLHPAFLQEQLRYDTLKYRAWLTRLSGTHAGLLCMVHFPQGESYPGTPVQDEGQSEDHPTERGHGIISGCSLRDYHKQSQGRKQCPCGTHDTELQHGKRMVSAFTTKSVFVISASERSVSLKDDCFPTFMNALRLTYDP